MGQGCASACVLYGKLSWVSTEYLMDYYRQRAIGVGALGGSLRSRHYLIAVSSCATLCNNDLALHRSSSRRFLLSQPKASLSTISICSRPWPSWCSGTKTYLQTNDSRQKQRRRYLIVCTVIGPLDKRPCDESLTLIRTSAAYGQVESRLAIE
jgi:hypothetical protein